MKKRNLPMVLFASMALVGGGLDYNPLYQSSSRSPKDYGQYLQRIGRQKWTKSKNRK